jgi:predicted FMN-binding regulatory protein PaiB
MKIKKKSSDLFKKIALVSLINQMEGKLCATHIPLELEATKDGKHILQGHIAKENPQWKGFKDDTVLTIFRATQLHFLLLV